jgi:hypothetical protein
MPAPAFSRATFLATAELAERLTQADITRLFLRIDYFDGLPDGSKSKRLSHFLNTGPLHIDGNYHDEARDRAFIMAVIEDFGRLKRWEVNPDRWAKDETSKKGVYDRLTMAFIGGRRLRRLRRRRADARRSEPRRP